MNEFFQIFSGWLEKSKNPCPTRGDKAWCSVCEKELRSHFNDLKKHSKSVRHIERCQENDIDVYSGDDHDKEEMPSEFYFCQKAS